MSFVVLPPLMSVHFLVQVNSQMKVLMLWGGVDGGLEEGGQTMTRVAEIHDICHKTSSSSNCTYYGYGGEHSKID